jgi:5-methylcytosine-specific restriction endonuclease McrA
MNPKKPRIKCYCGKEVPRTDSYYCSRACFNAKRRNDFLEKWLNEEVSGVTGNVEISTSEYIRKFVFERANYACELCGWDKKHPVSNNILVVIHHKDGDATNNKPDNLQCLCPNCHAMTETYGGYNRGFGRKSRVGVV